MSRQALARPRREPETPARAGPASCSRPTRLPQAHPRPVADEDDYSANSCINSAAMGGPPSRLRSHVAVSAADADGKTWDA